MTVSVRFAEPSDAAGVLAIYAPYCDSTCISFEIVAPTLGEMEQRLARISSRYPWLVCESDGRLAGYVYASQHRERAAYRWSVDVAVYLSENYHRRGIGSALYTALFAILREQGYFTAHAGITLPNEKSVGLHESLGFRQVGVWPRVGYKLGRWLDVGWWQLALQAEFSEPSEPLTVERVRERTSVLTAIAKSELVIRERSLLRASMDGL